MNTVLRRLSIATAVLLVVSALDGTAVAKQPPAGGGGGAAGGALAQCTTNLASCQAATCGNGVAEFGEQCDGQNLQGHTCQTQDFTYGKLACSGSCTFDTSGCTDSRFVDKGLTVVDNQTGLEWEKKDEAGGPHDKDNTYTWSSSDTAADGTAYTIFLAALNAQPAQICTSGDGSNVTCSGTGCFAEHCDWRLPEIDELRTILDCSQGSPCIDPTFGPTVAFSYWSATTVSGDPSSAWFAGFSSGGVFSADKSNGFYVRAVRAGSN